MTPPTSLNDATALVLALDRLVADDLPDADRRALLSHLEAHTDGWRRCALAFLEEQALRSALALSDPISLRVPASGRPPVPSGRRRPGRPLPFALAASIAAVAAGLGFRAGAVAHRHQPPVVVSNRPATMTTQAPAITELAPGQPVGWVGLINPAEGESLPRQVPVLAATAANEAWLQQQPAAIPAYVKAQWERSGYLVEENRRLVGLDLEDGRHLAVPIDELAVDYVGRQPL